MSTVNISTNKFLGKAFAISIDSTIYLLTVAHIIENPVTVQGNKVSIIYTSTGDDMALLQAPVGLTPIELADMYSNENLNSYIEESLQQLEHSSCFNINIKQGDSGSPILQNNKCIGMISGTTPGFGCFIPVEKIHNFINQYKKLSKLKLPKIPTIKINTSKNNQAFCEI